MSPDSISPRVRASRREGARSRGPQTAAATRAAANGLGHGRAARDLVLLDDEGAAAFAAFEAAGQAEAMAILIRRTLRRTWAPIFKSLRRMMPHVAVANWVCLSPMRRSP